MLFVTIKHLKPGMILAKDIILYNNNEYSRLLLSKGQSLNDKYINKIIYHEITGAYIENDAFTDIIAEPPINKVLESKSITKIKEVFSRVKDSRKKLNIVAVKEIASVVDELIIEILNNKELTNNLIELKNYDDYTYQHCFNVAVLSISTGISLGLNGYMLHDLGIAALLHDIGKMSIPLEILNKPDKLSDEEFEVMKSHTVNAVSILEHVVSNDILRGIESHHEKLNGSGYPYGRKGVNIPLYGKILAVCDVYDALTSDRVYRKTCFPNEVIEYLMGCADTSFDYEIIREFLKKVVAYPVGTFVKLSNEKIAVVVKSYSENTLRPVVRIINQDNTVGEDWDLLYDLNLINITIVGMGYDSETIDYNKILSN